MNFRASEMFWSQTRTSPERKWSLLQKPLVKNKTVVENGSVQAVLAVRQTGSHLSAGRAGAHQRCLAPGQLGAERPPARSCPGTASAAAGTAPAAPGTGPAPALLGERGSTGPPELPPARSEHTEGATAGTRWTTKTDTPSFLNWSEPKATTSNPPDER